MSCLSTSVSVYRSGTHTPSQLPAVGAVLLTHALDAVIQQNDAIIDRRLGAKLEYEAMRGTALTFLLNPNIAQFTDTTRSSGPPFPVLQSTSDWTYLRTKTPKSKNFSSKLPGSSASGRSTSSHA